MKTLKIESPSYIDVGKCINCTNYKDGKCVLRNETKNKNDHCSSFNSTENVKIYLIKSFNQFTDYLKIAEQVLEKQPIYFDSVGNWWIWVINKWVKADETDIMNAIDSITENPSSKSNIKTEILESLKRKARLNKPKDFPKTWIQFKNGIIDLNDFNPKKIKLINPTPEYFCTNPIPHNLGTTAATEKADKLFIEWVGQEYAISLWEILGYCLLNDYPIHRIFILIGAGLNGKGTFLRILNALIGIENITSTELDTLINSRFEITRLYKKLVCQIGETNFNELNKTSILKKLTGGDLIGFEFKNKTPFEDYNYAKIIIATNNLPETTDKTIGFYRRQQIIDFPNVFNETKDVLSDLTENDFENICFKCVCILSELLKKREFTNEGTIEERQKRYEDRSNPFDKFWKEEIIEDPDASISKKKFSDKFSDWCKKNNFRQMSDVILARHMKDRGITTSRLTMDWIDARYGEDKPRYWAWTGLKLKAESDLNEMSKVSKVSTHIPLSFTRVCNEVKVPGQLRQSGQQNIINIRNFGDKHE